MPPQRAGAVLTNASSMDLYHLHARAVSCHKQGQLQKAQALYEKIIRKEPYRKLLFRAYNNLALLFEESGDLRQAEQTYIKVRWLRW